MLSMDPGARERRRLGKPKGALMLSASGRVSTPELTADRIRKLPRCAIAGNLNCRPAPCRALHIALIERLEMIQNLHRKVIAAGDSVGLYSHEPRISPHACIARPSAAVWRWRNGVGCNLDRTMAQRLWAVYARTEPPRHHTMILAAL